MKKVVVSAPGKIHLSGEHAAVYGTPTVLVTTSKRLYVSVTNHDKNLSELRKKDSYLDSIIKIVEDEYKTGISKVSLKIDSDIPVGAGMGSSAALAVATIGALSTYIGQPWNVSKINELAHKAEKIIHGIPSGGDNTSISFGGLLWYRKEFSFLKTFWLLPFKIPKSFSPFVLMDTGRDETTAELVKFVFQKRTKFRQKIEKLWKQFEMVTKKLVQAIHDEDEKKMRQAIKENQRLLEKLGVVSKSTRVHIGEIEKLGGVAKISGAGGIKNGSGVVLATHKNPSVLINLAKRHKLPSFQVTLGGEGVKLEQVVA